MSNIVRLSNFKHIHLGVLKRLSIYDIVGGSQPTPKEVWEDSKTWADTNTWID